MSERHAQEMPWCEHVDMHAHLDPDSERREMLHSVDEFVALNERIARLCQALGLSLHGEEDLNAILQRRAPGFSPVDGALALQANEAARHTWQSREELRGLLVLRCDLLTRVVNCWGLGATREIVDMARADLQRRGFAPGAEGLALAHRLAEQDRTAQPTQA